MFFLFNHPYLLKYGSVAGLVICLITNVNVILQEFLLPMEQNREVPVSL